MSSRNESLSIVLSIPFSSAADWSMLQSRRRIVCLGNLALLEAAFDTAISDDVDLGKVIFDQSISSDRFLEFLSRIPPLYRGDILLIQPDGGGYVSAVARGDGRVLYRLRAIDVQFYIATNYGGEVMELAEAV